MFADPVFALIVQFAALSGIFTLCCVQAISEKTNIITQLEKWQSSLAVIIGFSAVIWTMRFDIDKSLNDASQRALKWYGAELLIASDVDIRAIDLDADASVGLKAREHKNMRACAWAVEEIRAHQIHPLEPFNMSDVDTLQIPSRRLAGIVELRSEVDGINQQIARLDSRRDCRNGNGFALEDIQFSAQSLERSFALLSDTKEPQAKSRGKTNPSSSGR